MTNTIKAVIFDFGNVLIRWNPHTLFMKYFSDANSVENFLAEVDFFEWNHRLDKGELYSKVLDEFTSKHPRYTHLFQAYFDIEWEETILGAIPETVNLLHRLKELGYHLYGLTNWSADKFVRVRKEYTFCELFDDIVVSGEVKLAKPDPGIFKLLLGKINHPSNECIFIDDSSLNIEAARDLGFISIHYISPDQLESELIKLGLF
jgi:2-haloacid dehalogenase